MLQIVEGMGWCGMSSTKRYNMIRYNEVDRFTCEFRLRYSSTFPEERASRPCAVHCSMHSSISVLSATSMML
jgi:hypothetical protein